MSTVVFVLICIYLFGTFNFYMGSNSHFYVTAFDYDGSVWYSSKGNIKAKVYNNNNYIYMIMTSDDLDKKYILVSLDNIHVELYEGDSIGSIRTSKPLLKTIVKSKKRWGRVCQFCIKNINITSKSFQMSDEDMFFKKHNSFGDT